MSTTTDKTRVLPKGVKSVKTIVTPPIELLSLDDDQHRVDTYKGMSRAPVYVPNVNPLTEVQKVRQPPPLSRVDTLLTAVGLGSRVSESVKDQLHATFKETAMGELKLHLDGLRKKRDASITKLHAAASGLEHCRLHLENTMIQLETTDPMKYIETQITLKDLTNREAECAELDNEYDRIERECADTRRALSLLRDQPENHECVNILSDLAKKMALLPKRTQSDKRMEMVNNLLESLQEKADDRDSAIDNIPDRDTNDNKPQMTQRMKTMLRESQDSVQKKIMERRNRRAVNALPPVPSNNNNNNNNNTNNDDNNGGECPGALDEGKLIVGTNKEYTTTLDEEELLL